jgi:hypothetical protein
MKGYGYTNEFNPYAAAAINATTLVNQHNADIERLK